MSPPPTFALLTPRRITVDEYERMAAAGSFNEPKKIELDRRLHGDEDAQKSGAQLLHQGSPQGPREELPPGWTSRQEEPVRIPAYDEPEPDIAIVRGSDADYRLRLPEVADVGLLVEVSENERECRSPARETYYRARRHPRLLDRQSGRPPGRGLHRSRPAGYASRKDFVSGQQVPVVIDGQQSGQIAVDDILP